MFSLLCRTLSHKWVLSAGLSACLLAQTNPCAAAPDTLAQQTSRDFTAVAKKAIPAVVAIKIKVPGSKETGEGDDDLNELFNDEFFHRFFSRKHSKNSHPEPMVGQASGFIVSPEGYLVTNSHVVRNATEIFVILNDGREFNGKVVGQDPNTDIAVVKIDAKDLPYLPLGDSNKLEIGEWAVAIGNPMGLQATLTVGVISALGRNNLDIANIEDFIQTDAAITRGNSGGPLLNLDSQVIGMNTAIVANMGMGNMGLGFAIPSNMIKPVMEQIIKTGQVTRGYIGVTLQTIDKDLAQAFNVEHNSGAIISSVSKDSPAEKAGLQQGDIIRAFNGQKVTNIATLRNAISLMAPGKSVSLTILRDKKPLEVPVVVGAFPVTPVKVTAAASDNKKLGFEVQDLTPELSQTLGLGDDTGVVVTKVEAGTPAALIGLKKGALVMGINQQKIDNVDDFNKALADLQADKPVILLVKQGDTVKFISIRIGK